MKKLSGLLAVTALLPLAALLGCSDSPPTVANAQQVPQKGVSAAGFSAQLDRRCTSYAAGSVSVSAQADPTCLACAASAPEATVDGRDESFATADYGPGDRGPITLTVSAAEGQVFAAGRRPAITLSAPDAQGDYRVDVRTLRGGTAQQAQCSRGERFGPDQRMIFGIDAEQDFDAFEVQLSRDNLTVATVDCSVAVLSGSNVERLAAPAQLRLHEFCLDFDYAGLD